MHAPYTQWRQRLALFGRIGRHLTHAVVQLFHERFVLKDNVSVNSVNLPDQNEHSREG